MTTQNQPTQAIALKYDEISAPKLTAKGHDELAEQIIQLARAHNIPIYENSELVRILSKLELGDEIPEILYRVIAEIIAFAYYLQGKVPKGFNDKNQT
jgi:flagellar biosynthesis protein